MASKIKVDQIEGSTGSTITIPTGQTFTVTDGIPVASGGTGLASFTAGDLLYATGSTTLAKLGKGTAEQVLAMNSGATAPDWGSVDLTVLPTITVAKGGTNISSFTAGDVLYATGATTLAKLAKGSAADVLTMNAGATAPEWAAAAGGGKLLQIVQVTKTSTTSTTSSTFQDMSGMSLAITPTAASSKILIMGQYSFGISGEVIFRYTFDVDGGGYNTIDEYTGDTNSASPRGITGANHAQQLAVSPVFLHSPTYTLTDVLTYKTQWGTINHGSTAYLNRMYTSIGGSSYPVQASNMVLMEIGA